MRDPAISDGGSTGRGSPIPSVDEVNRLVATSFPSVYAAGFRCVDMGDGYSVARWAHDPNALRPGGYISGPTQFAVADLALWFLTFSIRGLEPMSVTSELHITFLRPAVGGDLFARAELLRAGRSRINGRVDLWVDGAPDRPVSHAVGTYVPPS